MKGGLIRDEMIVLL